jgi:hypothetical protein
MLKKSSNNEIKTYQPKSLTNTSEQNVATFKKTNTAKLNAVYLEMKG